MPPAGPRLGREERPLEAPGAGVSAGRFLRDRRRRAAPAASGLALSSRRPGPARAGVSGSRPRGGVTWRAGDRGRGELGALLSPPRGGGARPAQASLSTPRPPARSPAHRPGRRGLGAPPPPGPMGRWEGARRKRAPLLPEWAAAPGRRRRSGSSSPLHPLPPLSTCGGPGQEEAAHGPGRATTVS